MGMDKTKEIAEEMFEVANCNLKSTVSIENKILTVRNVQVMMDCDLAELYGIETKFLNLAVKRNAERFPVNFMEETGIYLTCSLNKALPCFLLF